MAFVWFFVVLAITYNQGAARPANSDFGFITKNGLDSDEFQMDSSDGIKFIMPTSLIQGLVIFINGSINTNHKRFTVVLASNSGNQNCEINLSIEQDTNITITPAINGNNWTGYYLNISPDKATTFSLKLMPRVTEHGMESLGVTFTGNDDGESDQLICKIKSFQDINYIVMKEGVAHVDSLLFTFKKNH